MAQIDHTPELSCPGIRGLEYLYALPHSLVIGLGYPNSWSSVLFITGKSSWLSAALQKEKQVLAVESDRPLGRCVHKNGKGIDLRDCGWDPLPDTLPGCNGGKGKHSLYLLSWSLELGRRKIGNDKPIADCYTCSEKTKQGADLDKKSTVHRWSVKDFL